MVRILTAVAPDTEERVGARFDESRMFDLLGYIQADARHKRIPIVAAIIVPTRMTEETVRGLAHATQIFGASVFINLNDFADEHTQNVRLRSSSTRSSRRPSILPR